MLRLYCTLRILFRAFCAAVSSFRAFAPLSAHFVRFAEFLDWSRVLWPCEVAHGRSFFADFAPRSWWLRAAIPGAFTEFWILHLAYICLKNVCVVTVTWLRKYEGSANDGPRDRESAQCLASRWFEPDLFGNLDARLSRATGAMCSALPVIAFLYVLLTNCSLLTVA
jgi:hypothetical protein